MKMTLIFLTSAAIWVAFLSPVNADGGQATAQSTKSTSSHWMGGPKAVVGLCAGFVIGTPICFARKISQETREGAHGIVGSIVKDDNNKVLLIPATIVYLPPA